MRQTEIEGTSTKYLSNTPQVIEKNKEKSENCHRPEEYKQTEQLKTTWYPGYDPRTEQGQ